ncbi:MAG: phage tail terminator-like protein [bacterium]|nr:phage tail terminator-like protein [bacterium]
MSTEAISTAFEVALAAMPGALPFAKEGVAFPNPKKAPYAEIQLDMSAPQGLVVGGDFVREVGSFKVTFCFPTGSGLTEGRAKVDQIKRRFKHGTNLDANGIRVHVRQPPYTGPVLPDAVWQRFPVRVPFFADVYGAV